MEYLCPVCEKPYDGVFCTACTSSSRDMKVMDETPTEESETAYLVDLVTNRKIPIASPICKCGRDESNNIVISGDQSISRCHFIISKEAKQYYVKDENSRHGTFLNGKQLFSIEEVNDGDVLKVGVSLFWFVLESANKQAQPSGENEFAQNFQADATPVVEVAETAGVGTSIHPGKGLADQSEEDPSTVTSDNIPISVADDSLADKYRFKTHSFEAPNKLGSPRGTKSPLEPLPAPNPVSKNDIPERPKLTALELSAQLKGAGISDFGRADEPAAPVLSADELIRSLDMIPDPVIPDDLSNKQGKLAKSLPVKNGKPELSVEAAKGMGGLIGKLGASISKDSKPEGKALLGSMLASSSTEGAKSAASKPAQIEMPVAPIPVSPTASTPPAPTLASPPIPTSKPISTSTPVSTSTPISTSKPISTSTPISTSRPTPTLTPSPVAKAQPMSDGGISLDNREAEQGEDLNLSALQASNELKVLDEHLSELSDQLRFLQQKFEDLSGTVSRLRRIRNTLFAIQTLDAEDLTGSCFKVFAQLGFQVSLIEPDSGKERQELKLEAGDKSAIVRLAGPHGDGERTQLGQLTMTQARFWLEGKTEPKGILIVSSAGNAPSILSNERSINEDLADYAVKKNVCLMTTGQLLSIYSSMMTNGAQPLAVQTQILQASGWLPGFGQETGTNSGDKHSKVDRMSLLPA